MMVAGHRVALRGMTPALAEQVVQRARAMDWEGDYPAEGDIVAAQTYLKQCADGPDPQPFGPYQIVRTLDAKIVGGAGFHGPPENGVVEIGYGVVPSVRGQGFATEAARRLLDIARGAGVRTVIAQTETTNPASMRVLEHIGMGLTGESGNSRIYSIDL
jgi:Acetyltransferases, including N-acetylases of ribosomal proteins